MYGEDHMWTYQGYRIALLYGSLDFFIYIHRYSINAECYYKKKIYMIKSYKKKGYYYANKKEKGI